MTAFILCPRSGVVLLAFEGFFKHSVFRLALFEAVMLHEKPHGIPHFVFFAIDVLFVLPVKTTVVVYQYDVGLHGTNDMSDSGFLLIRDLNVHTEAGY